MLQKMFPHGNGINKQECYTHLTLSNKLYAVDYRGFE